MSNVLINETSLTAIGDAIRAKTGDNELLTIPNGMVEAINSITTGGGEVEPVVLTGDCSYELAGIIGSNYMKYFSNTISTDNITSTKHMFDKNQISIIPFTINCNITSLTDMEYMFYSTNLEEIPEVNNAYPKALSNFFNGNYNLRTMPEDFGANWNWDYIHTNTSSNCAYIFGSCFSLRRIPDSFLTNLWGIQTNTSVPTMYIFANCNALDEVKNFPIHQSNLTNNRFASAFDFTNRLKAFTFAVNEDGSPKTATWKSQTIDLSKYVGYVINRNNILNYNSGITADKEIIDDTTYQALKNDPDSFTCNEAYSRYNHDSAVETINSLPDTSATGTNTIKFKSGSGSKTEGGAISELTAEEIAVASAKGWTVSFV